MELEGQISEVLKPISWLVGLWESKDGSGDYPTIKDFNYNDTVEFKLCGLQPVLAYTGSSSHPEKKSPMHLESGFLRAKGCDSEVSFMVAHNFGVVSLEEGHWDDSGKIILKSKDLARMTGAKEPAVTLIERKFVRVSDTEILQELSMATTKTSSLTHHLTAKYSKKM